MSITTTIRNTTTNNNPAIRKSTLLKAEFSAKVSTLTPTADFSAKMGRIIAKHLQKKAAGFKESECRHNLYITTHREDYKLRGLQSISTAVQCNKFCKIRQNIAGTICKWCYAESHEKRFPDLDKTLRRNYKILHAGLLKNSEIPRFSSRYARVESFGDADCVLQCRNYIRIANANPDINFGIWSKNPGFWARAFDLDGKPENCTFVLSSVKLNEVANIPECIRKYVDHVFTVYTEDRYGEFVGTPHECAGISCLSCLKCYRRGTEFHIAELQRK